MRTIKSITALTLVAAVAAACSGGAASPSPGRHGGPRHRPPTEAHVRAPTEAPSEVVATPDPCAPETLALTAGTLTIGADNPAYPPYFSRRRESRCRGRTSATRRPAAARASRAPWPTRSRTSSASRSDNVAWVVVAVHQLDRPGAKTFDYLHHPGQLQHERAQAVDLSDGYYNLNQGVVAAEGQPGREGHDDLRSLKDLQFGARSARPASTRSKVIVPSTETNVYDTNDLAIEALKNEADRRRSSWTCRRRLLRDGRADHRRSVIAGQFPGPRAASTSASCWTRTARSPLRQRRRSRRCGTYGSSPASSRRSSRSRSPSRSTSPDGRPATVDRIPTGHSRRPRGRSRPGSTRGPRFGLGAEGTRSMLIATASTLVVFGIVAYVIVNSPGWPRVQERFLDRRSSGRRSRSSSRVLGQHPAVPDGRGPDPRLRPAPGRAPEPAGSRLLPVPAAGHGLRRSLPGPARHPHHHHARPSASPPCGSLACRSTSSSGRIVVLTLLYSAYVSEVYRAGIESVHPSQDAAGPVARPLAAQTMRHVVVPQAVRRVVPPLLNDFIGLQKDTVLISFIGIVEIFRKTQIMDGDVQLHAISRDRADLHRHHVPAGPPRRLARQPRQVAGRDGRRWA